MTQSSLTTPLSDRYERLVTSGVIERDGAQVGAVKRLDRLAQALGEHRLARKTSALGWFFAKKRAVADAPKGLYIWGEVGRGKTMLMDLFFDAAPVRRKRRVHFHAFMADVHERIFAYRQRLKTGEVKDPDPLPPLAAALAEEAWLLCFDEFTVTDIADAMILGRLFTALFAQGVVVVATSNVDPERLYEGGLNRALFLPFIALLRERMDVLRLEARADFRLEKLASAPVWYCPADADARAALDAMFLRLTGKTSAASRTLKVKGHNFTVSQASDGVGRLSFDDACAKPYAASDYLALAQHFHTVLMDDIPVMDLAQRNEAKRFILLIDALYEAHVKLIASAQAEPHQLYQAESGREAFEFDRTVSRLIEMRSESYLALPHGRSDSAASGQTTGLVET